MYSLKDKVVVVTGASSGIGKAIAEAAYNDGAMIAVCARKLQVLQEVFAAYDTKRVLCIQVDVKNTDDCKQFVDETVAKWGAIDVLVNNAGLSMRALFEDADISVIRELMEVNFFGTVHMTKYALPFILKQKGVILGVSSIAGYRGLPARTGYSASKFALQGFLESLKTELLHTGTHVMWVCPGFTTSNIRNVALASDGNTQGETPLDEQKLMSAEECAEYIITAIKNRKRTIVMTFMGKLTVFMNKLFPSFVDKRTYVHFLNEPNSPLKRYETNG